ncbi:hypothetical protein [uncultured Tenacibaculum sp.]|nr:hypothetical protein [uncultured Tenacibaculum sp.]
MLKNISNLGTTLGKSEQKSINGGFTFHECAFSADSSTDWCCHLPQGCPQ